MSNANPANIVNHSGNDNFGFDADLEGNMDVKVNFCEKPGLRLRLSVVLTHHSSFIKV